MSTHLPASLPACLPASPTWPSRYVANMGMCRFPLVAAQLAAAGISSFRFDHACAIYSKSERKGPFRMGNHEEECQDMRAAVDFVHSQGKRVVCLLGHRWAVAERG